MDEETIRFVEMLREAARVALPRRRPQRVSSPAAAAYTPTNVSAFMRKRVSPSGEVDPRSRAERREEAKVNRRAFKKAAKLHPVTTATVQA